MTEGSENRSSASRRRAEARRRRCARNIPQVREFLPDGRPSLDFTNEEEFPSLLPAVPEAPPPERRTLTVLPTIAAVLREAELHATSPPAAERVHTPYPRGSFQWIDLNRDRWIARHGVDDDYDIDWADLFANSSRENTPEWEERQRRLTSHASLRSSSPSSGESPFPPSYEASLGHSVPRVSAGTRLSPPPYSADDQNRASHFVNLTPTCYRGSRNGQ